MSSVVLGRIPSDEIIIIAIGGILTSFDETTSYYLTDEDGNILVIV
jgi:hypothetical protein